MSTLASGGTQGTIGPLLAVLLAETDYERMEFIKDIDISRKIVHEKFLDVVVPVIPVGESVVLEKSLCTGIHHENRPIEGIKQYAVSSLGAYAVHREQVFSLFRGFHAPISYHRPAPLGTVRIPRPDDETRRAS
jgi:hypothetical protein